MTYKLGAEELENVMCGINYRLAEIINFILSGKREYSPQASHQAID